MVEKRGKPRGEWLSPTSAPFVATILRHAGSCALARTRREIGDMNLPPAALFFMQRAKSLTSNPRCVDSIFVKALLLRR